MKNISKILISLLLLTGLMYGCIDETLPNSDYAISDQIEQSPTALEAMLNAIPAMMVNYKNDDSGIEVVSYASVQLMLEMMTTDMVVAGYTGYDTTSAYGRGAIDAKLNNRGKYPFFVYYGYIKSVNDIIGMIDADTNDETLQRYLGIAHAYRALYYMDLVSIYEFKANKYLTPSNNIIGLGVPIVTEDTAEQDAKNNPRATVEEVYELIFSDLGKAEKLLDGYARTSKTTPNLAIVYGLYARAFLNRASAGETSFYERAADYARKAIEESGCTFLTRDQWEDPRTGFNNMDSQNSWLWATSISTDNTSAKASNSFNYTMLLNTEGTWSAYGWRVGRALSRRTYDAIPDNDFRKYSWLDPSFFEEEGEEYSGYPYKVSSSYTHIRDRITVSNGFPALPYVYVSLKFRARDGAYSDAATGMATDYPIMRVEELYFIEAEARAHTNLGAARAILNEIMSHRITDGSYDCTSKTPDPDSFIEELIFQKRVEFWGEGKNYYDAKRLELGLHRGYVGINSSNYRNTFDLDGVAPQWTLPFPTAEIEGNIAVSNFDNPDPTSTERWWAANDDELLSNYGN